MLTFLAIVAYFLIGAVFVYFGFRQNPNLDNDGYMMPTSVAILFFWPVVALVFVFLGVPAKLAASWRENHPESRKPMDVTSAGSNQWRYGMEPEHHPGCLHFEWGPCNCGGDWDER